MTLSESVIDLGELPSEGHYLFPITCVNSGSDATLSGFRATCGCIVRDEFPIALPGRRTIRMNFALDLAKAARSASADISVELFASNGQKLRMTVRYRMKPTGKSRGSEGTNKLELVPVPVESAKGS